MTYVNQNLTDYFTLSFGTSTCKLGAGGSSPDVKASFGGGVYRESFCRQLQHPCHKGDNLFYRCTMTCYVSVAEYTMNCWQINASQSNLESVHQNLATEWCWLSFVCDVNVTMYSKLGPCQSSSEHFSVTQLWPLQLPQFFNLLGNPIPLFCRISYN